jgi:hypothetical protein
MLLRPTWSIPSDRQKIRDDARQRLEKERGYKEADGNSNFISSPTRGKKLVPGKGATPANGKTPAPAKGAQPAKGGQPAPKR